MKIRGVRVSENQMVFPVHTEADVQAALRSNSYSVCLGGIGLIHRPKDKMKSFKSNLQDNGLLLCPEVNQCCAEVGRPEERHFPSSSPRDGGHFQLNLIYYRDQHTAIQRTSISVAVILLPVCTSSFFFTPHCLSLSHSKDRWEQYERGSPTPLCEFIILHGEGGKDTERCSLGIPYTVGNFSEL